jgi:hypothetical protein
LSGDALVGALSRRMSHRCAALTVAATSVAIVPLLCPHDAVTAATPPAGAHSTTDSLLLASAEHRYRIGAKLRLGLFSPGRDDVGSALMTWRSTQGATALALLAGSDPQRAPGGLNRWAYLREEVRAESADVFTLRSDDAMPDRQADRIDDQPFNAGCASVSRQDVRTSVTRVDGHGATFRMFDRVLDRLEAPRPTWSEHRLVRPPGTEPGFLTALHRVLQSARDGAPPAAVGYVFNNKLYDLHVKRQRPLGRVRIGSRTFDALTRVDLFIRNRASGDITRFSVTAVPDAAGVSLPVQIFFQPSFWIVVELRLDEGADVPRDPADDGSLLTRMREICASVTR